MVEQYLPQTNNKCYIILQYPMCPYSPVFRGSKHNLGGTVRLGRANLPNAPQPPLPDLGSGRHERRAAAGRERLGWGVCGARPPLFAVILCCRRAIKSNCEGRARARATV